MRSACFFLGADVAPAEEPLGRWTDTEDKEEETESARGLLELEPEAKEEFFVAIFRLKPRKATSRKRELVVESLGGKQENGKCKHPANYQGNPHKPAQKVKETNWDLAWKARPKKEQDQRTQKKTNVLRKNECVEDNASCWHHCGRGV
jgi:hypothetical protein